MMGRIPQDVTEAELAVLKILWSQTSATIRQLTEQLYPAASESDYATVKKLLARLEKKQCVHRDRTQMAHEFQATITLDELLGRRLEVLANNLCDGSRTPLLMHLIRTDDISAEQQQQLRKLINDIATKPKQQRRTR